MKPRVFYAHTGKASDKSDWELLRDHLSRTARLAAEFARPFGAEAWGHLAGLWHDLGKYSEEFQTYLQTQAEACAETQAGRTDHSSAGAQHAVSELPVIGHMLAYALTGHHAGLLDGRSDGTSQEKRLHKLLPCWKNGLEELPTRSAPTVPDQVSEALGRRDAFSVAFMVRMLYSCLVDADFLATEQHMKPQQSRLRKPCSTLSALAPGFFQCLDQMETKAQRSPASVDSARHQVRLECERKAASPPGFFSLTVPTGGGKTLSSLAFALKHAVNPNHNLHRVIYVVPFTTIIEQNADVFRRFVGRDNVLEHHCSLESTKDTVGARLAAENWDAPIIVTTSVQFFDSLFANKPSTARKLHRLARSVIVLDEAQTLPVEYLAPCLRVLRELVEGYGCTVVLCTATQPQIGKRQEFEIGLEGIREIMGRPERLYNQLKRVRLHRIGRQSDQDLCEALLSQNQVLCIVNTTRHARLLFDAIGAKQGHYHLSARMCPAHRRLRLWQIRRALKAGKSCRVVSTQVVEAGVDVDFPVVYRALAGLDSIAQAAGRCNRNGRLGAMGQVFVFETEHPAMNRYFADTANCAAQTMALHPDPLDLTANERFFRLYYWDKKPMWDAHHILDCFHLHQNEAFPFNFSFATAARSFNLIDDAASSSVIIPWGRDGRKLCQRLRDAAAPSRELLRRAQRFAVRVFRKDWLKHAESDIHLIYDNLGILISPQAYYDPQTGLNFEAEGPGYYCV